MTWIKICGITNLEDARVAVEAGADAVGFVFYEKSPRSVDPERVRNIVAELPAEVEKVGVFVDDDSQRVDEVVAQTGLTAVQLYDEECAERVSRSKEIPSQDGGRHPRVILVLPGNQFADSGAVHLRSASWDIPEPLRKALFALLLDSRTESQPGGTGFPFDWTGVRGVVGPMNSICPTIVAGGLTPSNVATAMSLLHPWGVDVASGVEARPGKKDPDKVRAFVRAVRQAEKNI